jgi:hypothetical protein
MRVVAVTLVGALLLGGCAMQTGEPGTDDSIRSDNSAAEPGSEETTPAPRTDPIREGSGQAEAIDVPTNAPSSGKTASAPQWQEGEGLAPQDTKGSTQGGSSSSDPVPVPWQQGGASNVALGNGANIQGAGGN